MQNVVTDRVPVVRVLPENREEILLQTERIQLIFDDIPLKQHVVHKDILRQRQRSQIRRVNQSHETRRQLVFPVVDNHGGVPLRNIHDLPELPPIQLRIFRRVLIRSVSNQMDGDRPVRSEKIFLQKLMDPYIHFFLPEFSRSAFSELLLLYNSFFPVFFQERM